MISIIIPVFNAEKYLRVALESVLTQTYTDFEVICIDDGSCDNSSEIIREMQETDTRIRYLWQENSGPGAARNRGIKESKGDYLFFVDSDDYIVPCCLEILYSIIIKCEADIVVGGFQTFQCCQVPTYFKNAKIDSYEIVDGDCALAYADENKFQGFACNKLYKRILVEDTCFSEIRAMEDVEFNIPLFAKAKRVCRYPGCVYYYRQSENSLVHRTEHFEQSFEACRRIFDLCIQLYKDGSISNDAMIALICKYGTGNIMLRILQISIKNNIASTERERIFEKGCLALREICTAAKLHHLQAMELKYRLIYVITLGMRVKFLLRYLAYAQLAKHTILSYIRH